MWAALIPAIVSLVSSLASSGDGEESPDDEDYTAGLPPSLYRRFTSGLSGMQNRVNAEQPLQGALYRMAFSMLPTYAQQGLDFTSMLNPGGAPFPSRAGTSSGSGTARPRNLTGLDAQIGNMLAGAR